MNHSDEDFYMDYINQLHENEIENIDNFIGILKNIRNKLDDIQNDLIEELLILDEKYCISNKEYNSKKK